MRAVAHFFVAAGAILGMCAVGLSLPAWLDAVAVGWLGGVYLLSAAFFVESVDGS